MTLPEAPDDGVVASPDGPPGLFVSFEGGDGAGKSTQLERVAAWVEARGREVVRTREPGGTALGRVLRAAVLHGEDLHPRTEALLYATDRAHHVATVIRPALARGAVVLTDRYLDSSVAYQGAGRVLGRDEVRDLSLWATGGLLPHLTVLLDLDHDTARDRLDADDKPFDRLESEQAAFHSRVRHEFLALAAAEPERFLVLDASRSPADLATDIQGRVQALLAGAVPTGAVGTAD